MRKIYLIMCCILYINATAQFSTLHIFGDVPEGNKPQGSLILSGNFLYGMTYTGGANNLGCIFKIKTDGSGYSKIYDFGSSYGNPWSTLTMSGGVLYGTAGGGPSYYGCIFRINTDGTGYTKIMDFNNTLGSRPKSALLLSGNVFYGMTENGGAHGDGVIYKINTDGTGFAKLADFDNILYGKNPYGDLTILGNTLYGITRNGGPSNYGCVFKINTDGTGFKNLRNSAAWNSEGALTIYDSVLYGLSPSGGNGYIFKLNIDGSGFSTINSFKVYADGSIPSGSLTLSGDLLFGTAAKGGGPADGGTIFSINVDGTGFVKLYDFKDIPEGSWPMGQMVISGDTLYGMTKNGGANVVSLGSGTIFKYILPVRQNQTITFNAIPARGYLDGSFKLTATSSSGLPVRYTSSNTSIAIIKGGDTVITPGIGSTIITAIQSGNAYYKAATNVQQTLTIHGTGIVSSTTEIEFYPNPCKDYLFVKNNQGKAMNIKILDMVGNMIIERTITNEQIDISALQSGIYLLKIDGLVNKIIKQ